MMGCRLWHLKQGTLWLLLTTLARNTDGVFVPLQNRCQPLAYSVLLAPTGKHIPSIRYLSSSDSPRRPTTENIPDMEEVILSLCDDSDDTSRRGKLSQLLQDNLQSHDGGDAFIKLFDQALIVVGDRMRFEASEAAKQVTQNDSIRVLDDATPLSFPLPAQQKSLTEGRLWACVDMMVQSKMFVKQFKVKLGSVKEE